MVCRNLKNLVFLSDAFMILCLNFGERTKVDNFLASGCYFQEGAEVKMKMTVEDAYQRSIETVVRWIENEVNSNKTQVFFRTYAPVHFRFVPFSFSHNKQSL